MIDPNTILLVHSSSDFKRMVCDLDKDQNPMDSISMHCLYELSTYVNIFGVELNDPDALFNLVFDLNNYILDTVESLIQSIPQEDAQVILDRFTQSLYVHITMNDLGKDTIVSVVMDVFPAKLDPYKWRLTRECTELNINKFN